MNKKNDVSVKTTTRIYKRFSVGLAIIATIARLVNGSTSNMVMAQTDNGDGQRGTDWIGIRNQIQSFLIESCSQLVNTDGSNNCPTQFENNKHIKRLDYSRQTAWSLDLLSEYILDADMGNPRRK